MSRVDVLLPYRGDARYLQQAVRSLQAQTLHDWRAWLVRAGDPGEGDAIVQAAAAEERRLLPLPAQPDLASALAAAAAAGRAPLLCVLDGDDLLADAHALERMHQRMQAQPDLALLYSAHRLIDASGRDLGPDPLDGLAYSPDALLLDAMVGPLWMLRREACQAAGGFTSTFADAADYDLSLRVSEVGTIAKLPQLLYLRRVHPQSMQVLRWAEGIDARYRAFVAAVARRGLDARFNCRLEIDSRHVLTPLRPFAGWSVPGVR